MAEVAWHSLCLSADVWEGCGGISLWANLEKPHCSSWDESSDNHFIQCKSSGLVRMWKLARPEVLSHAACCRDYLACFDLSRLQQQNDPSWILLLLILLPTGSIQLQDELHVSAACLPLTVMFLFVQTLWTQECVSSHNQKRLSNMNKKIVLSIHFHISSVYCNVSGDTTDKKLFHEGENYELSRRLHEAGFMNLSLHRVEPRLTPLKALWNSKYCQSCSLRTIVAPHMWIEFIW